VDDATRQAYVKVLPDEQQNTTIGFLVRAVGWFSEQGLTCRRILSDNGSAYRSGAWRKACKTMAIKPIRTKPYTPQTNGKAERFIKTLLNGVGLCHALSNLRPEEPLVAALHGAT
jgi:transposase InsO family protein